MEWIRYPFVFITYCSWKILRKPELQIYQAIFDTLINSSVTRFHTAFLHKILRMRKYVQTIPFQFSDPQAQVSNKCLYFLNHCEDVSMVPLHTLVQGTELLKNVT
jgi:hypothetical protein